MATLKELILDAAMATTIPEGTAGAWSIRKLSIGNPLPMRPPDHGREFILEPGVYTQLFRHTEASAMQNWGLGELVMHDYAYELARHLVFMMRARGRVLVTGLGLGCVARGCLVHDSVTQVTVVENSRDVVNLVWPHMPTDPRLELVQADAVAWCKAYTGPEFDCAWHDLWSDEGAGRPPLQVLHMELLCTLAGRVQFHGAWAFPRYFRRLMREAQVI